MKMTNIENSMKMIYRTIVAVLLLMLCTPLAARPAKEKSNARTFRFMCYNVRNCKGADNEVSYERVANIINKQRPLFVGLQELDSMTTRYPNQNVLANLAEMTGMKGTFCRAIEFRGGGYGVGLLSRKRPLSVQRISLPCPREPRVLLVAEFKECYVMVTHWSLDAAARMRTAEIVNGLVASLKDKPILLCGDFNARPDEESMSVLAKGFRIMVKQGEPYTHPSWEPKKEIDYICVGRNGAGEGVEVSNHRVLFEPTASDHNPIVADIAFGE